jgi:hypothetical protein
MAEKQVPGGFLGAGGFVPPGGGGGGETLAQTYNVGVNGGDQTMVLADVNGGTITIDALMNAPLAFGARALRVLGGVELDATQTLAAGFLTNWLGNYIHGILTLTGPPVVGIGEVYSTFVNGAVIYGPGNVVNDAYNLFIEYAPNAIPVAENATVTRGWGLGMRSAAHFGQGIVLRSNMLPSASPCNPPGEADIVISDDGLNTSAQIVSEPNTGRIGYRSSTQQFYVSMNGSPYAPLGVAGVPVLSAVYAAGALATNQTLHLLDVNGGGITIEAWDAGFTGTDALTIAALVGGTTSFPRIGGFSTWAQISRVSAPGVAWDEVLFDSGSMILTGAPGAVTALTRVRVRQGSVVGLGNTIADGYNLLVDAAPFGTATFTRSWSFGVAGDAQFQSSVFIGAAATAATANLHLAAGTVVAGTASLKINAGVVLTVEEPGAVESDGAFLYWTDSASTRISLNQNRLVGTTVNVAGPYVVLASDVYLRVTRTATAPISIQLPAINATSKDRIIAIGDAGYNCALNNITLVLGAGGDKINNVNANYTMAITSQVLWLVANTATSNWELV